MSSDQANDDTQQPRLIRNAGSASHDAAALEALLFVSDEPVEISVLASALDRSREEVERALQRLDRTLRDDGRGIALQWLDDSVQLVTAPRFSAVVSRFLSIERTVRLSSAALETLAIVAYRQPVTRADIEAIRGVDSSGVLNTLVARELVEVSGRRATPGTPLEYSTTPAFLRHFGLSSLDELVAHRDGDQ